jgi:serine/threonine protein kinase
VVEPGELVAGRYRLVARVGRGAMGVVWRARDERLDRVVAVKQLLSGTEKVARREGRVGARLRHPHAIMVHDSVEHDGQPWLVMEYFESTSLATMVARGVVTQDVAANVGHQIAAALAAAHADGIVHRDVKPGNVLIAEDGTAKLADFGISRALGDGTMTGGDIMVGTPAYLAPEVATGEQAGFSSDVFSFGATLYTALEGRPPFGDDDNPIAQLQRVAHDEITPPRQSGPVVDVVRWMLCRHPGERPTMREVHDALTAVVEGRATAVPQPPPHQPTLMLPAPSRRSRRAIAGGVAAALLLAAGVVIGMLLDGGPATVTAPDPGTTSRPATAPVVLPSTTAVSTAVSSAGLPCEADYVVTGSWPGGYQVYVTVSNKDRPSLAGWTVSWALPAGHTISQLWNGALKLTGSTVEVRNEPWNGVVARDNSTTFGLNATGDNPGRLALTCQSP